MTEDGKQLLNWISLRTLEQSLLPARAPGSKKGAPAEAVRPGSKKAAPKKAAQETEPKDED